MIPPDQRRIQTGFDYSRLVAYELGDQAVEAVMRQFERGLDYGHPAAGVILEILRSEPGRTMTFAPPGVPLSRLHGFEDGYALDLDPFDPYGWSTIWAQHIVDRLTGSANPYVVSLDLNIRGRSNAFWTHESSWEAARRFRSTLLWVGDLEMQAAQGAAALDVPTVHEMLGITNQLWAMNVIAGDSPIPLPGTHFEAVDPEVVCSLARDCTLVVVQPYECHDGFLFWERLSRGDRLPRLE
ncbi:MAG: hypothetical protein ABIJ48_11235 [Actinomycetota bacterium]